MKEYRYEVPANIYFTVRADSGGEAAKKAKAVVDEMAEPNRSGDCGFDGPDCGDGYEVRVYVNDGEKEAEASLMDSREVEDE